MYNCPKNKFSSHSCTCKWRAYRSPLHVYIFSINITEERNSFKLFAVISCVLTLFVGTWSLFWWWCSFALLCGWETSQQSSSLPSITASNYELKKNQESSRASSVAKKCLQVWIQAHRLSDLPRKRKKSALHLLFTPTIAATHFAFKLICAAAVKHFEVFWLTEGNQRVWLW